jgi:hypothetical protein
MNENSQEERWPLWYVCSLIVRVLLVLAFLKALTYG